MNTAFRIIWSHTREAFVVVDELTSARGKRGTARVLLAGAGAGLLAFASPAMAVVNSCPGANTILYSGMTLSSTCSLGDGASLTVLQGATLNNVNTWAVEADPATSEWDSVDNGGLIKSTAGPALLFGVASGTSIHNLSTGQIVGLQSGVALAGSTVGSLLNDGSISAVHANGSAVSLWGGATLGSLVNTGTITGNFGISIADASISGDLVNTGSGTISAVTDAIRITGNGSVDGVINNSGVISGGVTGINVLFNPGSSLGTPSIGGLDNSGRVDGGHIGIQVFAAEVKGDIINRASGMISSGTNGDRTGILIGASQVSGSLINSGTIIGTDLGVYVDDSTIRNIVNEAGGTISAGAYGLVIANNSTVGAIINAGTISGDLLSIYILPGVSGNRSTLFIEGNNTARFIGAVEAPSTDVVMRQNVTYTMRGGEQFNVNSFRNDGTLSLAATRGTTGTINGSYIQGASGVLKVGVADGNTFGKLYVNGRAELPSNAKIVVDVSNPASTFSAASLASVLSAHNLSSDGTFAVSDNSLLFDFGAVRNGNAVDLTLKAAAGHVVPPVGTPQPANPSVEQVVKHLGNNPAGPAARVLDQTFAQNPTGALASHFVSLTTEQQVSDAVTQTLPLLTGGTHTATSSTLSGINRVVQARQDSNSGLSSGDAPVAQENLWIKTFGSWADQSERSGISGYDANTQGLAIGVDGALSEQARLGVAFAYANTNVDSDSRVAPQDAQIDTFQLIGYGSYALAPDTELNFQVDAGQNRNQGKRHMPFADATAKADYDSYSAHAGLGLGHTLRFTDTLTFVPSVRADYTWIGDEAYHEKGAGALNLNVDRRDAEELIFSVDGKLNYNLGGNTVLSANLGAGYDVINETTSISSTYAGSPAAAFTTRGLDPSPWLGRAGLGLSHTLENGTEVSVRYDAESRSDYLNQGASIKARWAF